MNIAWLIGLAVASILFFFAYLFLSQANYKQRFKQKYDIRNSFPYEFNYESKFTDNILGNIALVLSAAFSLGLFSCSLVYRVGNGLLLISLISGALFTLLFVLINFIPLKLLKTHMAFAVLLFVASFATPASIGLTAFRSFQESKSGVALTFFIISIAVALFNFVLVMNPKLSLNIKMQIATDEKGNEYYIRPKFIIMAFNEWLSIFTLMVSEILLIAVLFIS